MVFSRNEGGKKRSIKGGGGVGGRKWHVSFI